MTDLGRYWPNGSGDVNGRFPLPLAPKPPVRSGDCQSGVCFAPDSGPTSGGSAKDQRAWNAGRKIGAKRALKLQQVWAIRFWLDRERRLRDRAMFDLAIDSKLRGCDVVKIKIGDLVTSARR
jgi:hypothetical protein